MTPREFSNFSVQVFTVLTYFGIHYATTDLITKKVFNFCVAFIFILEKFIRRKDKYLSDTISCVRSCGCHFVCPKAHSVTPVISSTKG